MFFMFSSFILHAFMIYMLKSWIRSEEHTCIDVFLVYVCVLGVFEGFDGEIDLTRFILILIRGKDAKHAK